MDARSTLSNDPLPDPEPSVPSLPGPDPGVFHHPPAIPQPAPIEPEALPA
jgi:hypothetical protein